MGRLKRISQIETPDSAPRYEHEIWQLPAAASPHVTSAHRVAGLRGRNLQLVEHRVLRKLSQAGVKLGRQTDAMNRGNALTEGFGAWT